MNHKKQKNTKPTPKASPAFFLPTPHVQKREDKSNPIGKLIADQLADDKFKKHIASLGELLQELALEATDGSSGQPASPSARLSALNLKFAFENSAKAILNDQDLKQFREQFSKVVKGSPTAALALALVGVAAAYLADMDLKFKDLKHEFGKSGYSIGGGFDLGKAQDLKFKEADLYGKLATKLMSVKAGVSLKKDEESGDLVTGIMGETKRTWEKASLTNSLKFDTKGALSGTAKGQFKFGDRTTSIGSTFALDPEGKMVLSGKLAQDILGQKNRKLTLSTELNWPTDGTEVLVNPSVAGKMNFKGGHALQFGTSVGLSTASGLKSLKGFLEYQQGSRIRLRFDGDIGGVKKSLSLDPGTEVKFQGTLILFF